MIISFCLSISLIKHNIYVRMIVREEAMNTDRIRGRRIHVSNGSNFLEFGRNAIFRGSWAGGSGEFPGLSELVSMETTPKPIRGAFVRTFTLVEARLQHSPYPFSVHKLASLFSFLGLFRIVPLLHVSRYLPLSLSLPSFLITSFTFILFIFPVLSFFHAPAT